MWKLLSCLELSMVLTCRSYQGDKDYLWCLICRYYQGDMDYGWGLCVNVIKMRWIIALHGAYMKKLSR